MTASELCEAGGMLTAVKGDDGKTNVAWLAHAPKGFRFTNGRHVVRREMDQTWADRLGYLGLEPCPPECGHQ